MYTMSHRVAKKLRKYFIYSFAANGKVFSNDPSTRVYMQHYNSPHTAMNVVGSARSLYQMSKENIKRIRRGEQTIEARKFK